MRKQTKVVAVASAAALLAIGGAMTSFAAQGWVEEDGGKNPETTGSGLIPKRVAQWLPISSLKMTTIPTM